MSSSETTARTTGYAIGDVVGVFARRRTYKRLLYLLLAFPLGMIYYVALLVGFGFGALLSTVVVGIGIVLATVVGSRFVAGFERRLANALLDLELRPPDDVATAASAGPVSTLRGYLEAPSTWRGLGFLSLKLWTGFAGFVILLFVFTALELLTTPLRYPHEFELVTVNDRPITWMIETLPEALAALAIGLVLVVVTVHAANAVATLFGRIATALLDGSRS